MWIETGIVPRDQNFAAWTWAVASVDVGRTALKPSGADHQKGVGNATPALSKLGIQGPQHAGSIA